MQKLKLLILSWEIYPVYCGGLGVLVKHLVQELKDQGHHVDILIPNSHGETVDDNIINLWDNIEIIQKTFVDIPDFNFTLQKFNLIKPRNSDQKNDKIYPNETPKITQYYAYAVKEYLENSSIDYDMVIGMDWPSIPTFKLLKDTHPTLPFAFYVNGTEYDRNFGIKKLSYCSKKIGKIEKDYYKQAKQVFTVSNISSQHLNKHHRVKKSQLIVIHNDSEYTENIDPSIIKNEKEILFLGRIAYQKGIIYLLQALNRIVKTDNTFRLKIVGSGSYKPTLVKYIDKYSLNKYVTFVPWLDGIQKLKAFQQTSLFVIPSVSEPFGLTALEAIRSGAPVLASNMCGFTDLIPSTPTYQFNKSNLLAKKIIGLFSNTTKLKELHKEELSELSSHSWKTQIEKFVDRIIKH